MNTALQETKPLAAAIKRIFAGFTEEPKKENTRLAECWPKIVGERIAAKTKPSLNQGGVKVYTESSALSFELSQNYGPAILKRLQNEFGEERIKKIWFCVSDL